MKNDKKFRKELAKRAEAHRATVSRDQQDAYTDRIMIFGYATGHALQQIVQTKQLETKKGIGGK